VESGIMEFRSTRLTCGGFDEFSANSLPNHIANNKIFGYNEDYEQLLPLSLKRAVWFMA